MTDALETFILNALNEDIGSGDITTLATISPDQIGNATFLVKEDCIIAGVALAKKICKYIDNQLDVNFNVQDGDLVKATHSIGTITGSIHSILKAERLVLNCMQRMSAIATKTNRIATLVKPFGVSILDTRKTTPNFRVCEKWAVLIGGGVNHRIGLYDQILIKDNHIQAGSGIKSTLNACQKYIQLNQLNVPVVVEVKNIEEFEIAKAFDFIDRILVDNMSPAEIVQLLKHNTTNKLIEASGGINETNIVEYAKTGIHFISLGDLTHHVSAIDISLKII
jgi:nicotinate-nucleotide pyrophosphorylase (carboxylating)